MDEKIEKAIKPLTNMYEDIENELLNIIASHFSVKEEFLNSDYWRIKKLEEMGLFNDEVVKYIARATKTTSDKVYQALNDIGIQVVNYEKYRRLFEDEQLKINPDILKNNYTISNMINFAYNELNNQFIQMSSKIDLSTRNAYLCIVESTYLKTSMGTHSYQEAIREAINDLSNKGLTTLTYQTTDENGNIVGIRNYDIEGTVRRETLTAVRQLSNNINMEVANELQCEYIKISEHLACRPNHFPWQGTIIKREDLIEVTHYGEVDGLGGINCKHYFEPYYGDKKGNELKKYTQEETAKAYKLSQHQRYLERGTRKWKRKAEMFKSSEDLELYSKAKYKTKEWQLRTKEFTEQNNLKRDFTREYVNGYKETKVNLKPSKYIVDTLNSAGIIADDSLSKMDSKLLKRNVNQINKLSEKYNIIDFYKNQNATYYVKNTNEYIGAISYNKEMDFLNINSSFKYFYNKDVLIKCTDEMVNEKWFMPCAKENYDIYAMTHEFGHTLEMKLFKDNFPNGNSIGYTNFANEVKNDIIAIAKRNNPNIDLEEVISLYGRKDNNPKEFFAECFANMELGETNELGNAMREYLKDKGVIK